MAIALSFFTPPSSSSSSFSSSKSIPSFSLSFSLNLRLPRSADRSFALRAIAGGSDGGSFGGGHGHGGHGGGGGDDEHGNDGRNEAVMVMAEAGRALESVPADLAAAIKEGKIPAAVVTRFLELEKSAFFRWLLQFPGFRERLLADDLFLAKVAMECGVGVFTKVCLLSPSLLSIHTCNIDLLYNFAVCLFRLLLSTIVGEKTFSTSSKLCSPMWYCFSFSVILVLYILHARINAVLVCVKCVLNLFACIVLFLGDGHHCRFHAGVSSCAYCCS